MKTIGLKEEFFEGAVSFERGDGWIKPWRVIFDKRALFASPEETLLGRMECTAGIRLRFKTVSGTIVLNTVADEVTEEEKVERLFDLTIDNELIKTVALPVGEEKVLFDGLPEEDKTVDIWFPQKHAVALRSLEIDDDCDVIVEPDKRLKWITYGSSITHCSSAHSPARTWPATAARALDLNLTTLGFGGNCHLEPMVARMIRDLPVDIITLKVGINIQGAASLGPRTFKAAVIGAIEIIREKHPDTPIGVISPIISPPRETTDNLVGLSLSKMRVEIEDAVKRIISVDGDTNLHYFNGLEIFGEELLGPRLPDELHPDGDGYEIMGRNVAEKVLPKLLQG